MVEDHGSTETPKSPPRNVHTALITGVTIALSCRAAKIQYKQICFLTSFEPNKVYLGPNRNNKGAAIIYEISRLYWISFYLYYWYYELHYLACRHHRHLLLRPPPFISPNRKTRSGGGGVFVSREHYNAVEIQEPRRLQDLKSTPITGISMQEDVRDAPRTLHSRQRRIWILAPVAS